MADDNPQSRYGLGNVRGFFVEFYLRERAFLVVLASLFLLAGVLYPYPGPARWLGFLIAGYAAIGNDSIQTIGTFISSNEKQRWWVLWCFIGGIFVLTVAYSWVYYGGDVSYGRLTHKGFNETPSSFEFLQVAAPIFLLMLTRLKMPVSTTFLLLSSFATEVKGIGSVLEKSLWGYVYAFVVAGVVWGVLSKILDRVFEGEPHPAWRPVQWVASGLLWSVWIMQDAANIAVYLPRSLSGLEFAAFAGSIFLGLGLLFYFRGEAVQEMVDEKSGVVDVRSATVIDLVYAAIMIYFKEMSDVPMSTTWVFIGLLGGRELAMAMHGTAVRNAKDALRLLGKDVLFAAIGLVVSLILAAAVNPLVREQILLFVGLQ